MTESEIAEQLGMVRHQIEGYQRDRLSGGWSPQDESRLAALLAEERELLEARRRLSETP